MNEKPTRNPDLGLDQALKKDSDDRLEAALAKTGARDPREAYRKMLRDLKTKSEDEYGRAVERFQDFVVTAIAARGAEPLGRWLQFGQELAQRLSPGRNVVIDETGKVQPATTPPSWEDLILHIPDERGSRALVVGLPPELSRAQRASVGLLVDGQVRWSP